MSFKIQINALRRRITRSLTKNVGTAKLKNNRNANSKVDFKNVLISRPNHRLGNLLLISPLVQEINATFPDCKIDLFVKGGLAPIIFKNYTSVDNYINLPKKPFNELLKYIQVWIKIKQKKYDLVINIDKNSSSGRLSTQYANADYKFFGEDNEAITTRYKDHVHMAKYPLYEFRYYLEQLGFPNKEKEIPTINMKLSNLELKQSKIILDELVPNDKKTIAIFTFATGEKCYSPEWWNPFYEKLKIAFPDYHIVEVLPVENVSQINFKAPSFYSKDVREIAAFIANTELFIGADSGIMHLACASQIPVLGLFSVTIPEKYEPYGNGSIAIDTNTTTAEGIIELAKVRLLSSL
ncbi:glycosyltransferase family 9 protein [Flavobacterium sp. TAB 87]|uniref:glycosyltransferase family 9 protein n=1 Tax=Flavobacterium sp. TAB 87 TaxID=1729581 RepID=UPI00076C29ED|nr:glycosyltransferase family 9 protein [Flavobacterium sp. TAB 87]KVV13210.1 lipopolysaccharide core biosynthesis protein [Flavobacterium sp. TAB 87]